MRSLFIGSLIFLFCIVIPVSGQQSTVDPRSVDVNSMSDQQIGKIINEIEKRGLTENEAIALAQARGLSQTQISVLRQRMNEVKMQGGASGNTESGVVTQQAEPVLSKKVLALRLLVKL